MLTVNICCPRDCVSRHNGGTSGAPLKPLRVDSALSPVWENNSHQTYRYEETNVSRHHGGPMEGPLKFTYITALSD